MSELDWLVATVASFVFCILILQELVVIQKARKEKGIPDFKHLLFHVILESQTRVKLVFLWLQYLLTTHLNPNCCPAPRSMAHLSRENQLHLYGLFHGRNLISSLHLVRYHKYPQMPWGNEVENSWVSYKLDPSWSRLTAELVAPGISGMVSTCHNVRDRLPNLQINL